MGSNKLKFFPAEHPRTPFAPDFSQVALSNDAPIEDALEIVIKSRKRNLREPVKRAMISQIENFCGDKHIGALRSIEDEQWATLKIPVMARLYLKHLINQSVSLTALQLLECDFNGGRPIDWNRHEQGLQSILNMGFQRVQAYESLIICRGNLNEALNYLLLADTNKKSERERAKRLNKNFVPPTQHHSVLAAEEKANEEMRKYDNLTGRELKEEIERLQNEIEETQERNKQIELEIQSKQRAHQKNLYREYLKGLICDNKIDAVEQQHLLKYKKNRDINEEQHKAVLQELGVTPENFEQLKDFKATNNQEQVECSVCFDPGRDWMIMPCNHVCLCEECALEDFHPSVVPDATCPQCREPIVDIKKVLFS